MATLAQLGVAIDSGPAKKGGAEVRDEFKKITTDARTVATTVDSAFKTVGKAATATKASTATVTVATKELSVAAQQYATNAAAMATRADAGRRAFEQLAQAAAQQATQVGELRAVVTNTAGAFGAAAVAGGGLRTALAAMGGPLGVVALGLAALPDVLQLFQKDSKKATEEARALRDELEKLSPAALQAAKATELALQDRIRSTPMSAGARAAALDASNARLNPILSAIGSEQTQAALQYDEALKKARASSVEAAEALRLLTTSGEKNAEVFKRAAAQWVDGSGKARTLLQALREGDASALEFTRTIDGAVRSERAYADAQKASADAIRDRAKAAKEAQEAAEREARILSDLFDARRKWSDQLAKSGQQQDEQARKEIARNEERRQKAQETADDIITAQTRQLAVIGKSESAVKAMARAWGEQDLIQKLVAQGLDVLTAVDVARQWRTNAEAVDAATEALQQHEREIAKLGDGAEAIAAMTRAAGALASAFGGVGTAIGGALDQAGSLLESLSAAQRAGVFKDASGNTQNVGFGGALSGAAGIAGVAAASSATLGVVGAVAGIASALSGFGDSSRRAAEQAEAAAQAFAEARAALKKSVESYTLAASGTSLDKTLAGLKDGFDGLIRDLLTAGAPRVDRLGGRTAKTIAPTADDVNAVIDAYEKQVAAAKAAAAEAARWADLTLSAREASARGDAAVADRLRQQISDEKELADARREGADAAALARLATLQAAEAQQREAAAVLERVRTTTAFNLDVAARRNALNGNDRAAFEIRQQGGRDSALQQAQDLFAAGKITSEMLAQLTAVLNDEFNKALSDYDAQVRRAQQSLQDELGVRILVATGRDAEAEAMRRDIANRKELEGITDAATIAQIQYVQALEASAVAQAEAANAARVVAEQNADIDRRMVTALQTLNPTKAAELQAKLTEVERARELASVTDAATRARLQELYAMQDAAAASAQLTQSLRDQAEAAQKAADFTATVRDDFLRATGNTLAAEKEKLTKERDDRLKTAQELGLASDIVDQINATYQTKLQKLMNDSQGGLIPGIPAGSSNSASNTMPPGTSVGSVALSTIPGVVPERTDAGTVLGGDTVTFRGGNSITETSGMRLIDYAASQLAVLREIRDAVVAGGPAATDLLPSLARQLDRTYGRTTSDQLRSVFGEVA